MRDNGPNEDENGSSPTELPGARHADGCETGVALRAARAALRTQVLLPVGLEKLRAAALVPHDPAAASAAFAGGASATGTVGGGRPAAVAAVALQTLAHLGQLRLQTPDAPTQLVNLPSKTANQAPKPG